MSGLLHPSRQEGVVGPFRPCWGGGGGQTGGKDCSSNLSRGREVEYEKIPKRIPRKLALLLLLPSAPGEAHLSSQQGGFWVIIFVNIYICVCVCFILTNHSLLVCIIPFLGTTGSYRFYGTVVFVMLGPMSGLARIGPATDIP